ncbi:MAG: 1-acyl-sn-glycerol-3-phosphate acyltransferase [Candidatus Moranbacteria bacterium]|nr:1-acyl-sn-glycerol-3-phosphate acyltransferase [Candidatus Moranbacteria bacterium]
MNKKARVFQMCCFHIFLPILKLYGFEVKGLEKLKEVNGAVIFAANHVNPLDGIITAVAIAMHNAGKFLPVRYLAFAKYFSWIHFQWPFIFPVSLFVAAWIQISNCIPVKSRSKKERQKMSLKDVLSEGILALENGERLFIFPEGAMNRTDEMLLPGKRGVACLHKETGAPIVPMAIHYCSRKITVSFGEPICDLNNPSRCDLDTGTKKVMKRIEKLLVEINGG